MGRKSVLPLRSKRFGVGKEIGGAVYVHRLYLDKLGSAVEAALKHVPADFAYHIVKYNYRTGAVSFIESLDFDTADEPIVGQILTVGTDQQVRRRKQARDPEIYHHKWLFVAEDYDGFDVEKSRQRSLSWIMLDDVDRKKIGRRSFWNEHVIPRITRSCD